MWKSTSSLQTLNRRKLPIVSDTAIPPVTDEEKASWPKEPLVSLEKPFVDSRGAIQPLVDEMMKSAVMIESAWTLCGSPNTTSTARWPMLTR